MKHNILREFFHSDIDKILLYFNRYW